MACSCQNKGIGRIKSSYKMAKQKNRRRRARVSGLNSKDVQGFAVSAVIGGVGSVILKMVLDKVLPAEYAQYSSYAQIAGGVLVGVMSKNSMVQAAGMGAATVGAANVVADLTDGQTNTLGLLPYGRPSSYVASIQEGVKTM